MTKNIDAGQNFIDSRDIIERMEELQDEREALADALTEAQEEEYETDDEKAEAVDEATDNLKAWDDDNGDELKELQSVNEQGDGYGDWRHGEQMIHERAFKDYARELADETGYDSNAGWPMNCIDWDHAAEELKQDYMEIDYSGETYYIRA